MPSLSASFLLFGLVAMDILDTSCFPADFLILHAVITTHTGAGLAALTAVVIDTAYFVTLYRKAFLGPTTSSAITRSADLQTCEPFVIGLFALLIFVAGFYPASVLNVIDTSAQGLISRLG